MADAGKTSGPMLVNLEIVFALPQNQQLIPVSVPAGTTCREAIALSRIGERCPDEELSRCPLAVWGRPVADNFVPSDGDRIELLRPLHIDPRDARRQLAEAGEFMGKVGGSANED